MVAAYVIAVILTYLSVFIDCFYRINKKGRLNMTVGMLIVYIILPLLPLFGCILVFIILFTDDDSSLNHKIG